MRCVAGRGASRLSRSGSRAPAGNGASRSRGGLGIPGGAGAPRDGRRARRPTYPRSRAGKQSGWRSLESSPSRADLLILDEPTNYLDLAAVAWLEGYLVVLRRRARAREPRSPPSRSRHDADGGARSRRELSSTRAATPPISTARIEREDRAVTADAVRRNLARRELAWLRRGAPARTPKASGAHRRRCTLLVAERPAAPARATRTGTEARHAPPRATSSSSARASGTSTRPRTEPVFSGDRSRARAAGASRGRRGQRQRQVHLPRHPRSAAGAELGHRRQSGRPS